MRKTFNVLILLIIWSCMPVSAQMKWINPLKEGSQFIHGRGWPSELKNNYHRFPARAKKTIRPEVWGLSDRKSVV